MKNIDFEKINLTVKTFCLKYGYLICSFMIFMVMDVIFRRRFSGNGIYPYYNVIPMFFSVSWSLLFTFFIYITPRKFKRYVSLSITLFFAIYIIGQTIYFNLFYKYFTILDTSLLGEGAEFVDISYFHVNYSILIVCVIAVVSSFCMYYVLPSKEHTMNWKSALAFFLVCIGINITARSLVPNATDAATWNSANEPGNIYEDYSNTTKALLLSGTYEYTFRDVYLAYNPLKYYNEKPIIEDLDAYIAEKEAHAENQMSGIFKDKNLIFVQLENIDNWMLTEENMPNLYALHHDSIDFINHYATAFATGKTFNTEFIVNTGLIPQSKGNAPSYIYSRNSYPYSMANMFKKAGYTVNSYHSAAGHVYNRAVVHETFGYERYNSNDVMMMEDYTMDSQMMNNFDAFVTSDRFMDYLITYSAHGPFDTNLRTCSEHLDEVKQISDRADEVYLCGLAQARETDKMIGLLMENLKEHDLYDNTVLIFVTDHYAYSTIDAQTELELKGTNDPNLLSNVSFFIWSSDQEAQKINKYTGTVDVLPTVLNLFGLEADYRYLIGNDIFTEYDDFVFFQDGSIINSDGYF